MSNTHWTELDHEKAFKLWRQGNSLREIADQPGMPSYETIHRWSKPDYDCPYDTEEEECPYHGWKEKHNEIVSKALEEVEKDLPSPLEREKKRLNFLYETERQLNEMIESGELEAPRTLKSAVNLLSEIYNEQRLLKGKSTNITEMRGADHKELNLQKVLSQVNVEGDVSEDDFIEAVEDSVIEGEGNAED